MNINLLSSGTRKFLGAGAVILALGAAVPVQAADNVRFGFSFGEGNFSLSIGNGGFNGRHFAPPQPVCMTENQLRARLRDQGYRHISFGGSRRGWLHTSARRDGRRFSFDTNTCNGAIANLVAERGFGSGGFPSGGHSGFGGNGFPSGNFAGGKGFPVWRP